MQVQLNCCFSITWNPKFSCGLSLTFCPDKILKALKLGNSQNKDSALLLTFHLFVILCDTFICIVFYLCTVWHTSGFGFKLLILVFAYPCVFGTGLQNFFLQGKLMHRRWQMIWHNHFLLLLPSLGSKWSSPCMCNNFRALQKIEFLFWDMFISVLTASNCHLSVCLKTDPYNARWGDGYFSLFDFVDAVQWS